MSKSISEYRRLKRAGFDVNSTPTFQFSNGSETVEHAMSKLVVAHLVQNHGWMADCEVSCPDGEIDVLAYSEDRLNYALEVETNPATDIAETKLQKYVKGNSVVDDVVIIDISDVPDTFSFLEGYVDQKVHLW
jgi:RecB family endonuclease NucS